MIPVNDSDNKLVTGGIMADFEAFMAKMCRKYGISDEFDVIPLMTAEEQRTAVRLMIDPYGYLAQAS